MQETLFIVLLITVGIVPVLLFSGILIYFGIRRYKSKKKVKSMEPKKKIQMLNELLEPFGFYYDKRVDLISSLKDAWQRNTGYNMLYDKAAARFNMVIDELPVYFDYQGRTWLIEFWKGQYGITTGCEVGLYYADEIVKTEMRKLTHYKVIEDSEMPYIQFRLSKKNMEFTHNNTHWWLTAFRVGEFSKPEELDYRVKITFRTRELAKAFFAGLKESGYPEINMDIRNQTVYVWLPPVKKESERRFLEKRQRKFAQWMNKRMTSLYKLLTNPFDATEDRILFLYLQLPVLFRGIFKLLTALP